jgi:uncharacterized BrkB/YihY/UPF0761 family membrane protein
MKGQMTIIGILMIFLTLVVLAVLIPQFNNVINQLLPNLDDLSAWFVKIIPITITICILFAILWYARPIYERGE